MQVVIGVDSGGSKTRSLAVRLDGTVVGHAESGGGNPSHDSAFHHNIGAAIRGASSDFEVLAIVSGIAGLDGPSDHDWAEKATDVLGPNVKRLQINDADIALFGALEGRPGIICIQGEGSMVLAKTESGRMVRNFDFLHYANAAAPRTGFRATYAVLSGADDPDEADFVAEVLRHWGANSIEELREAAANWYSNREAALRTAGRLAPAVTKAADDGLPAAVRICRLAASEIAEGVALLGPFFEGQEVEVSLSGSCGRSPAISRGVQDALVSRQEKTYRFVEPRFSAVEGAVLWALGLAGVELSLEIKANLRSSPCRGSAGCSAAQNLE